MVDIREITVGWGLPAGSGRTTVMYFGTTATVASQRAAIKTFLTAALPYLGNGTSFGVDISGRTLESTTGALTGSWAEPTLQQGVGTGGTTQIADAAQILVRWKCPTIINGRFLQGRTFLPGVAVAGTTLGNVAGAAQSAIQTAGNTFIASASGPYVWHRPVAGSGGQVAVPTSAEVWGEFAVLRKRRG